MPCASEPRGENGVGDQVLRIVAYLRLSGRFKVVQRDIDRLVENRIGMGQGPGIFHDANSNIFSSQERQPLVIVPRPGGTGSLAGLVSVGVAVAPAASAAAAVSLVGIAAGA